MNKEPSTAPEKEDFSLVLGGPLYQLLLRGKLVRPTMELVHRRVIASVLVTWLPLAVLTALTGSFLGGLGVPFFFDLDVHIKFLISLPLLIGAELIVHRRVRMVVEEFLNRELIAPEDRPRFEGMIARAMRLRNSVVVEVLLLVLAFTGGYWLWRTQSALQVAAWYAAPQAGSTTLTGAGYWYAFVSLPIGRFILLRWYFRLYIWYVFLWRVSRLPLRLNPLHPDRAGGLGFLEFTVAAFAPVLIAQSAFLSGAIANRIWHEGAKLPDFKFEIAGFIAFLMLLVLLPLTFFAMQLLEASLAGSREFGRFASRYVNEFRQKWQEGRETPDEPLVGTGDIQSLADLANSFEVVRYDAPPAVRPETDPTSCDPDCPAAGAARADDDSIRGVGATAVQVGLIAVLGWRAPGRCDNAFVERRRRQGISTSVFHAITERNRFGRTTYPS